MKIVDIQKSLVGNFPKVVAPGRRLLMQGFLMKVPRSGGSSGLPRCSKKEKEISRPDNKGPFFEGTSFSSATC